MKKWVIGGFILALVLVLTFFLRGTPTLESNTIDNTNNQENTGNSIILNDEEASNPVESTNNEVVNTGITEQDLAKHDTKEDCWVVYSGKVYDVTDYLPRHPGGEDRIGVTCGTLNFESAFTKKHGTSKVSLLMKVGTFIGDFDVVGDLKS